MSRETRPRRALEGYFRGTMGTLLARIGTVWAKTDVPDYSTHVLRGQAPTTNEPHKGLAITLPAYGPIVAIGTASLAQRTPFRNAGKRPEASYTPTSTVYGRSPGGRSTDDT